MATCATFLLTQANATFLSNVEGIVKPECCMCCQGQVLQQIHQDSVVEYSSNLTFCNMSQIFKVTGYTCMVKFQTSRAIQIVSVMILT